MSRKVRDFNVVGFVVYFELFGIFFCWVLQMKKKLV